MGDTLWTKTSPGQLESITTDKRGDVIVTGSERGTGGVFDFLTIKYSGTTTGIEDESEFSTFPLRYVLHQNYPNPFNSNTCLSYNLSSACSVTIIIYNLKGQKVQTLISGYQPSGYHSIIWDGKDDNGKAVASGIYLYQMLSTSNNSEQSQIRKMVLLK